VNRTIVATALISAFAASGVTHYCDARLVADILHSSSLSISENVMQANAMLDQDQAMMELMIRSWKASHPAVDPRPDPAGAEDWQ
jgi:hypothetical protein